MDERPPGWYRDPDDARAHRYWNGQGWIMAQPVQLQTAQVHHVQLPAVQLPGDDESESE